MSSSITHAQTNDTREVKTQNNYPVVLTFDNYGIYHLETKQASWAQIFDALVQNIGVRIHYSDLPKERISVKCSHATIRGLIECLLKSELDIAFRYAPGQGSDKPAEMWLVSNKGQTQTVTSCVAKNVVAEKPNTKVNSKQKKLDETPMLLEMARSDDPQDRMQAYSQLAYGKVNTASVRAAFEAGLADKNPEVRAQAINGYALKAGATAQTALQTALHDPDPSVRLMVVDNANPALLLQLQKDPDPTVRAAALMKSKGND